MSIKSELTSVLGAISTSYQKKSDQIQTIKHDIRLSEEGKSESIAKIVDDLAGYITIAKRNISKSIEDKIVELNNQERENEIYRATNVEYAFLLHNTIDMLPHICDKASISEIKERLDYFKDDPIAIAAIKDVIGRVSSNAAQLGSSIPGITSVIPMDTRGSRQEHLKKMLANFNSICDSAVSTLSSNHDSSVVALIDSVMSYIECANDDCTEKVGEMDLTKMATIAEGFNRYAHVR